MGAQLSLKAVMPLAEILGTASDRCSNTGPGEPHDKCLIILLCISLYLYVTLHLHATWINIALELIVWFYLTNFTTAALHEQIITSIEHSALSKGWLWCWAAYVCRCTHIHLITHKYIASPVELNRCGLLMPFSVVEHCRLFSTEWSAEPMRICC